MPARRPKRTSDILATLHESIAGLYAAGLVDPATMRKLDELCEMQSAPMAPDSEGARPAVLRRSARTSD
jgi:hypothetical protein